MLLPTERSRTVNAADDGDRLAQASLQAALLEALDSAAAADQDFVRIVDAARSVSTDDEHDPDGAGLAVERALITARVRQARARLTDLTRAVDRVALGRYGRCEACGGPIGAERLAARPAAPTCIGCATEEEHGR